MIDLARCGRVTPPTVHDLRATARKPAHPRGTAGVIFPAHVVPHRPMLRPANVVDLPILRALIRDGAIRGSFDRELATESRAATLFFSNLRQALATGYFVEEDPRTGDLATVAVPGYVYLPESGTHKPIGFGLFKAATFGYELWLTAVDAAWRGHGHGRAMMAALLETPPGKSAYVVRVNTFGRESPAMGHLLVSFGYACARETPQYTWYVRNDAPLELRQRTRSPLRPPAPNDVRGRLR
jgi:GNAT superfamily N-acetyltransferase